MQNFDIRQLAQASGTILPLAILLIRNDADRQFLTDTYLQYRPLLFKVACQYFGNSFSEADDAVGSTVELMCKNCDKLQTIACNKRALYIVSMIRNVCLTRLREIKRQRLHLDFGPDSDALEAVSGPDDVQEMVFCNILAPELLNAFLELSEKEREIIRMRHIDRQDYAAIAELFGVSEGAARTAVCRAKRKLEQLAINRRVEP